MEYKQLTSSLTPKLMGNSILSCTPTTFFKTAICYDFCTWRISNTQKIRFRPGEGLPHEGPSWRREETECCACKILPMTSTCGQGNFSVKLSESRKWGKFKGWLATTATSGGWVRTWSKICSSCITKLSYLTNYRNKLLLPPPHHNWINLI